MHEKAIVAEKQCRVYFLTAPNCYSDCTVIGNLSSYLGGLCGSNSGNITNCYSTGSVDGHLFLGGLCGYNDYSTFTNCFWDTETSGMTDGQGNEDPDPAGVLGRTTAQMQTQSTFTDHGWDFDPDDGDAADWRINNERDYPKLIWQPFGDVNNDSFVNTYDHAVMSMTWLKSEGEPGYNSVCELSGDTTVDTADLAVMAQMWLEGPSRP